MQVGESVSAPQSAQTEPNKKCELEIVDENDKVISGKKTVAVGQRIILKVRPKDSSCSLLKFSWTIPGTRVKGYTDGSTSAKVSLLEVSDTLRSNVSFHWVDGATSRTVKVKCECVCGSTTSTVSASVDFEVQAPTLDRLKSTTGAIKIDTTKSPSWVRYRFNLGIAWDWKITVPKACGGEVKDVQIINAIREYETTSGDKYVFTIKGMNKAPGQFQLDTTNPYITPADVPKGGFPQKVGAGKSYECNYGNDSPGQVLPPSQRAVTIHDIFRYFVMYKPDTGNAIWVPVGALDWFWKATVKLEKTGWTIVSSENNKNPSGSKTTEFPLYSSNVAHNAFQKT